jgi:hypothetical protein
MERRLTLSFFLLLLSVSTFAGKNLTSLKLSHFLFGSREKNKQKVMGLFRIVEKWISLACLSMSFKMACPA